MVEPLDTELIQTFAAREGVVTHVNLTDGRQLTVHNIAWGYDQGDPFAHITTNISPDIPGATVDCFSTQDVDSLWDGVTTQRLI